MPKRKYDEEGRDSRAFILDYFRRNPEASLRAAAKELDVSHNLIWLILKEEGLIGLEDVSETIDEILRLGKLSQYALAQILDTSNAQVSRWRTGQQANKQTAHRLTRMDSSRKRQWRLRALAS